jgi:hypothetical protein
MLGSRAVSLAFLWAINTTQADTFWAGVVQDFDGVAVEALDVCDQAYLANDWTAFQLAADSVKTIAKW